MQRKPKELVHAKLMSDGQMLRSEIALQPAVDPRAMALCACDLLEALEQKGFVTPMVAQAHQTLLQQCRDWGLHHGLDLPSDGHRGLQL